LKFCYIFYYILEIKYKKIELLIYDKNLNVMINLFEIISKIINLQLILNIYKIHTLERVSKKNFRKKILCVFYQ